MRHWLKMWVCLNRNRSTRSRDSTGKFNTEVKNRWEPTTHTKHDESLMLETAERGNRYWSQSSSKPGLWLLTGYYQLDWLCLGACVTKGWGRGGEWSDRTAEPLSVTRGDKQRDEPQWFYIFSSSGQQHREEMWVKFEEAVVSGRQCVFVAQCVTVELNSTVTSWKFHRTKKKTRALGLN